MPRLAATRHKEDFPLRNPRLVVGRTDPVFLPGGILNNSRLAAAVFASAIVLAGCANTDTTPVEGSSEQATTSTPAPSASEPTQTIDPLKRLPEQPFGLDPSKMAAAPETYGIQWDSNGDRAGEAEAVRVMLQAQWLANERNVLQGGADSGKIQASIEDARYFLTAEALPGALDRGQQALDFTERIKVEGKDAKSPDGSPVWYPFHHGVVASPVDESEEQLEKGWPAPEYVRGHIWLPIEGENDRIPYRHGDKVDLTPRIYKVFRLADGRPGVVVQAHIDYEIPLLDERTAQQTYDISYWMVPEDGRWKVNAWKFEDSPTPITIKQ